MAVSHAVDEQARKSRQSAMDRLQRFLDARRRSRKPVGDLEQFEEELHALFAEAESEAVAEELARFDVDTPLVMVDGVAHRRVLRCEETYFGTAGPLRVERSLYSTRGPGEKSVCPLELRAGIVEGRWTPLAAKQATWVVTHLTPQEGEDLFAQLGGMKPSKSSLDRLPKRLSRRWEEKRQDFEQAVRLEEVVPKEAKVVAVSLDGVKVPMKNGQRKEKRASAEAEGKQTSGPAGYQEVGCGTVSLYDKDGERVGSIRLGRMPEHNKATLKSMLVEELEAVLEKRPRLRVVKLADGALDNWSFLEEALPPGPSVVDFYHAAQHLKSALDAAYGEASPVSKAQFERQRQVLREDPKGVDKIIRALAYLRDKRPRRKQIVKELKYFRRNRWRMRYAKLKAQNLPIGTGVVEAACKTLATQRMKRSGMRWQNEGGQAILTFRSLVQSDRFHRGWELLAATYKRDVSMPTNVVALNRWGRAA